MSKIQERWKQGYVLGFDCIAYANDTATMANTYSTIDSETKTHKQHWFPLCDTTLEGVLKYDDDIWTEVDIFHGGFEYKNQRFVFGDGGMGNEGYVASTRLNGDLNWSIFFTFSNPIHKAEVIDECLICYGDTGTVITVNLNNITEIQVAHNEN